MKKSFLLFAVCYFVASSFTTVSAQSTMPAPTDTMTFSQLKSDTTLAKQYKSAISFVKSGKKGEKVTIADAIPTEVHVITEVPSKGGKKETQEMVVYTTSAGDIKATLSEAGTTVIDGAGITTNRGDDSRGTYW